MRFFLTAATALLATMSVAAPAHSLTLAESRFDAGAEGWAVRDLAYPDPGAPPVVKGSHLPTWRAGGYVEMPDPSDQAWYWLAPAAFLGDRQQAYGGSLSWDLAVTGQGFGSPKDFMQEDVLLVGAGMTLATTTGVRLPPTQAVTWRGFAVDLVEGVWHVGSDTGPLASASQIRAVLGDLDAVYLRGEYLNGLDDVGRLDNVVLTAVPEPATGLLLAAGLTALWWRRRQA